MGSIFSSVVRGIAQKKLSTLCLFEVDMVGHYLAVFTIRVQAKKIFRMELQVAVICCGFLQESKGPHPIKPVKVVRTEEWLNPILT